MDLPLIKTQFNRNNRMQLLMDKINNLTLTDFQLINREMKRKARIQAIRMRFRAMYLNNSSLRYRL